MRNDSPSGIHSGRYAIYNKKCWSHRYAISLMKKPKRYQDFLLQSVQWFRAGSRCRVRSGYAPAAILTDQEPCAHCFRLPLPLLQGVGENRINKGVGPKGVFFCNSDAWGFYGDIMSDIYRICVCLILGCTWDIYIRMNFTMTLSPNPWFSFHDGFRASSHPRAAP